MSGRKTQGQKMHPPMLLYGVLFLFWENTHNLKLTILTFNSVRFSGIQYIYNVMQPSPLVSSITLLPPRNWLEKRPSLSRLKPQTFLLTAGCANNDGALSFKAMPHLTVPGFSFMREKYQCGMVYFCLHGIQVWKCCLYWLYLLIPGNILWEK